MHHHRPLDFAETLYYVRNLKAGNHGIFFYRSSHEKHEVLFNFFQAGFEKGEGAVYVAAQETSKQIRRQMEDFGLNVKTLEKDGVLRIFDYDDWYIIDGKVDVSNMIMLGQLAIHEAMEIGLKGLRGCGEAACFFEHKKEKDLVEYELMIGRKLDTPLTALCAYDVNHVKSLEDKFFFSLIRAHGPVITHSFAQEVKFENLFPTITHEVLETVFGKIGKKIVLEMLYERHSLALHEITGDPRYFIEGLEDVVGSGAQVIAKSIVRQMHSKMGITQQK